MIFVIVVVTVEPLGQFCFVELFATAWTGCRIGTNDCVEPLLKRVCFEFFRFGNWPGSDQATDRGEITLSVAVGHESVVADSHETIW